MSLCRRLPNGVNQTVQVHSRREGGIARGNIARPDRPGKARIQLANIVRRTLRHVLRYIAVARWNVQLLEAPSGACSLKMDRADLWRVLRRGDEGPLAP